MINLTVSIELRGKQVNVGSITGKTTEDARFSYGKDYLLSDDSRPISISLPLNEEPFSPNDTRNFF